MLARPLTPVAVLLVLLLAPGAWSQTTWWVDAGNPNCPGTGSRFDPFCAIQDAFDFAGPGDLVLVAPGVYDEDLDADDLSVRSDADGDPSTHDADPALVTVTGLVDIGYMSYEGLTAARMENAYDGPGQVRHCIIDSLELQQSGAALDHCQVRTIAVHRGGYCDLDDCTVSNPSGDGIVAGSDATVVLRRSKILSCAGLGIRAEEYDADIILEGSIIAACEVGAVSNTGDFARTFILESTIADNGEPALFVDGDSSGLSVEDSILSNEGAIEVDLGCDQFSFAIISRSLLRGGRPAIDTSCEDRLEVRELLDADPSFVDPAALDFHLREDSPCINRGLSSLADIDGESRPFMGGGDLGADEFYGLHRLAADRQTIDHTLRERVNFVADAGPAHGGRHYLMFVSISGTIPGLPIGPGAVLPINNDGFTTIALRLALKGSPSLPGFFGTLDGAGRAAPALDTLGPLPAESVGLDMTFAYAVSSPWDFVSNPVTVEIR